MFRTGGAMCKEIAVGGLVLGLMGACSSDSTTAQPSGSEAGTTGGQSAAGGSSGGAVHLGGGAESGGRNSGGTTPDASSASGAGGNGGTDGSIGAGGAAGSGGQSTGGRVSADAGTGATAGSGGSDAGSGSGFLVSVTLAGPGQGGVMDSFAIIDCGRYCQTRYRSGTQIVLSAHGINGTNSYFEGWSGDCTGSAADCPVTVDRPINVTAHFALQTHNFVFVSSEGFPNTKGGAAAYDYECNRLANAAGINDLAGDAFVAWTSDRNSRAMDRVGTTARGFVRLDGVPVVDSVSDLTGKNAILNPIRIDEHGADVGGKSVMTGTLPNGDVDTGSNCNDFYSDGYGWYGAVGGTDGGPGAWTNWGAAACATSYRVYCFMKTSTAPLVLTKASGKRIFLTNGPFSPGGAASPDARCDADKPPGTGAVKALLTYNATPAADAIDPAATYVRVDGQVVGTGADLVAVAAMTSDQLRSGIWQSGDGSYPFGDPKGAFVWTGGFSLTDMGAYALSCADWTSPSPSGVGRYAAYPFANSSFWYYTNATLNIGSTSCDQSLYVYCVEQ
jgi:hypothetical protein